ncbi:kinesin light chain-like [Nasonia vitripennis]|uniref:Uncharacterized protein n=1 Tax=Nasonia vitripennis TaxID=7425 RepID=A0A7M7GMY9_NASVI|nr:kinesin light chain-like [Nasonia vitripennis]
MLEKGNIAIALVQQGKYNEALAIFEEAYEDHKKILGEDHPHSMMIQRNIGEALKSVGKYDEALKVLKTVYKKQKKVLGPDSPDTILTVNSIGYTLHGQNKLTEALKLLQESLEKCRIVLGPEHPSTLKVINSIAVILTQEKKYGESLKHSREVLKIQEKILGIHHNDTLSTKHNIATALFESGKLDEALKIYKEIRSKEKDSTRPDSLSTKKNMLLILTIQGKLDEALKLSKELLNAQEIVFGKRHKETFLTKISMVEILNRANKSYSAFKILREIFETADDDILNTIGKDKITEWMNGVERETGLLFSVIRRNDPGELQELFDYGRDVNSADKNESTLLHYAAANGHNRIVEVLLKNGADVNLINIKGDTALHEAAANGLLNIVMNLLKFGSMYDVRNNEGATALDLCKNENSRRLLKSVREAFAYAEVGDGRIIHTLNDLQPDELEAVQKTRNKEGKTFFQLIIMQKHKHLPNIVLDIIRGKKIVFK